MVSEKRNKFLKNYLGLETHQRLEPLPLSSLPSPYPSLPGAVHVGAGVVVWVGGGGA